MNSHLQKAASVRSWSRSRHSGLRRNDGFMEQ